MDSINFFNTHTLLAIQNTNPMKKRLKTIALLITTLLAVPVAKAAPENDDARFGWFKTTN